MKKLLLAMLFAAVLVAAASPLRAQEPMIFSEYYGSQQDALNAVLDRLLQAPPYRYGYQGFDLAASPVTFGFWTRETELSATKRTWDYYFYTYVYSYWNNVNDIQVYWFLNGTIIKYMPVQKGMFVYDHFACDSIYILKNVGSPGDDVFYGGLYNR